MTTNALAGTCYVTVDGTTVDIVGEGTYQCSGATREPLQGQNGFQGYSEKQVGGMMSWKGRNSASLSIATLNNATNSSVVFELINGKTIIGTNMFRNGEPIKVDTEEATLDLEFFGPSVTEN